MHTRTAQRFIGIVLVLLALGSTGMNRNPSAQSQHPGGSYLVQAASSQAAASAVRQAGGTVKQPLALINAVSADLSPAAVARLSADPGVTLYADQPVWRSGGPKEPNPKYTDTKETDTKGYALHPAAATQANLLHEKNVSTLKQECKEVSANDWKVVPSSERVQHELQGWGVTVAVVDSGFAQLAKASDWKRNPATGELFASNSGRCLLYRDFLPRDQANANSGIQANNSVDQNGHGTHVAATIADNRLVKLVADGKDTPVGVAPQVNLVLARALDVNGAGTYSSVIASIDWIVQNRQRYNIRVLNLSLYAPVTGPYWADPLNQAVMKAWQSDIVVVAAAGNDGPEAGTITAPGNVPYVITVGAIKSGRYTGSGYDELAAYSSRGPTESAFVKPDVLVPASRTIAPMPLQSTLATTLRKMRTDNQSSCTVNNKRVAPKDAYIGSVPAYCYESIAQIDFNVGAMIQDYAYYQLSGTSMAAAEVSGAAALILQANPKLNNDQVKYRLQATARPATATAHGESIYTPWEQGAGLIDIEQAVFTDTLEQANLSMDIALDLDVTSETQTHYWGNTIWDEATGEFRLIDPETGEAIVIWNGTQRVWGGTQRVWGGGYSIWAGTQRVWGGTQRVWGGGYSTWAGSDSLWAGTQRVWGGTTPNSSLSTAMFGETLIEE
jgi:serine protease AprX